MQLSNDDSVGAVLEDNVPYTHGIHPACTPPFFVLSVSPFAFCSHFDFGEPWNLKVLLCSCCNAPR